MFGTPPPKKGIKTPRFCEPLCQHIHMSITANFYGKWCSKRWATHAWSITKHLLRIYCYLHRVIALAPRLAQKTTRRDKLYTNAPFHLNFFFVWSGSSYPSRSRWTHAKQLTSPLVSAQISVSLLHSPPTDALQSRLLLHLVLKGAVFLSLYWITSREKTKQALSLFPCPLLRLLPAQDSTATCHTCKALSATWWSSALRAQGPFRSLDNLRKDVKRVLRARRLLSQRCQSAS